MIKRSVSLSDPQSVFVLCIGSSFALLAGAHLFERVGGLPPCLLCLEQREVHWAALLFGAVTFIVARIANGPARVMAAALGAITLVYVYSASLAGYHAGVEWGFWAGPETCAGGGGDDLASSGDLLASLSEKSLGPGCSEALWRMFGISMAGYNALISIGLAGLAAMSSFMAARGLKYDRVNETALAE
ncbi:MAG: disulfide bond formation protein B [Parvularculaceae bacterium]|nr:disulfide bond formation protein B [Parvularculaceae bacterium]